MRKVVQVILVSFLQLIIYVLIHEFGIRLASSILNVSNSGLHWGITIKYSVMVFGVLAFMLSIIQEVLTKNNGRYLSLIVTCLLFCIYYFNDLDYTPYRTLLLMLSGILGFTIPLLFKWKYFEKDG